jgi:hypothetical protein
MTDTSKARRVVTGTVRLSYANLFTPKVNEEGKAQFSVMLLIPKSDEQTIAKLKAAAKAAIEAKWGNKPPPNLKSSLRDGDIEHPGEEPYAGHYFINVRSNDAPQVVDERLAPITDPTGLVSGDFARVSLGSFGYDAKGNRGVSFGLGNVQRVRKGEPLGSRVRAENEFAPVDADGNDFDPLS